MLGKQKANKKKRDSRGLGREGRKQVERNRVWDSKKSLQVPGTSSQDQADEAELPPSSRDAARHRRNAPTDH